MCETGKQIGYTSSGVGLMRVTNAYMPAMTDASACHAPFGSDVDPDVWYSQRLTRSGPGGGGNTGRIAGGERVAREHGAPDLGRDLLGQRTVGEPPPLRSDHEELGARLVGDVAHLALAHDRDDRVLHRAESGERGEQHERVDGGGELPAHDGARPHAEIVQAGGGPLGVVAVARRTVRTRPCSSVKSGRSGLSDARWSTSPQ